MIWIQLKPYCLAISHKRNLIQRREPLSVSDWHMPDLDVTIWSKNWCLLWLTLMFHLISQLTVPWPWDSFLPVSVMKMSQMLSLRHWLTEHRIPKRTNLMNLFLFSLLLDLDYCSLGNKRNVKWSWKHCKSSITRLLSMLKPPLLVAPMLAAVTCWKYKICFKNALNNYLKKIIFINKLPLFLLHWSHQVRISATKWPTVLSTIYYNIVILN